MPRQAADSHLKTNTNETAVVLHFASDCRLDTPKGEAPAYVMAIESSGGPLVGKAYLMATFAYLNSSDLSKGWTQFDPVRDKNAFLEPFLFSNDQFTETGSGQTYGKLRRKGVCCRRRTTTRARSTQHAQRLGAEKTRPFFLRSFFTTINFPGQAQDKHENS